MRFLLCIIMLFAPIPMAFANLPIPIKKPTAQNNFESILTSVAADEDRMPRPPKIETPLIAFSIITPPPLPNRKKHISTTNETTEIIDGIPLPNRKPLSIKLTAETPSIKLPAQDKATIITYSGNNDDDRTASSPKKVERSRAQKRETIRETSEKSPFKTTKLPRAGEKSSRDPIIIFFKENSSELEVGQIAIIKSDILNILKQSSARKVGIYGYAESNAANPDKTSQLSLSRALLISEFLADNRIDSSRIEARSMGADTPISPKNRVDVIIY